VRKLALSGNLGVLGDICPLAHSFAHGPAVLLLTNGPVAAVSSRTQRTAPSRQKYAFADRILHHWIDHFGVLPVLFADAKALLN